MNDTKDLKEKFLEKEFKILQMKPPETSLSLTKPEPVKPEARIKKTVKPTTKTTKPTETVKPPETEGKMIESMIKSPELRGLFQLYDIKKRQELDPISAQMTEVFKGKEDILKDMEKKTEEFSKQLDTYYSALKKAVEEKLPEPPKIKDFTEPKNALEAFLKGIVPAVVGVIAMVKGGKYGENYVYFNSMMDAIRKEDERRFKEAMEQWKLDFDTALREKQQKIDALRVEGEAMIQKSKLSTQQKELAVKSLENDLAKLQKLYTEAENKINKFLDTVFKAWKAQEEFKIKRESIWAGVGLREKEFELKGEKAIYQIAKLQSDILKALEPYIKNEDVRNAVALHIIQSLGVTVPPSATGTETKSETLEEKIRKHPEIIFPREAW